MSRVLIVDDEVSICWALRESLCDDGHEVEIASSAEEGLRLAESAKFDALVLDVRLPGVDGLTAMQAFRERLNGARIVVITAFGNLETAVKALEGGAFDYLVKPFDLDRATTVIGRALEQERPNVGRMQADLSKDGEALVGSSPAMQELFKNIALVAASEVPVLITGESGTGKEVVARAIHKHSRRRAGPFLPVCIAALSPSLVEAELFGHVRGSFTDAVQDRKGLLELAQGGTVLLDEVGDIPAGLQVKLLRAIEQREVTPVGDARPRATDIRVIAATNRPLGDLIANGQFREDLFYRLSVFQIHIPPLRERRDDIAVLAEHFLEPLRRTQGMQIQVSRQAIEALQDRPWKGNIRELRNAIERAAVVARGATIRPEHLPPPMKALTPRSTAEAIQVHLATWAEAESATLGTDDAETLLYARFLALAEPPVLQAALKRCQGNRAAAATMLGIHRATLRQKLRKYEIG
jgi:two-component system nitrogen regulation response regulator GlnG